MVSRQARILFFALISAVALMYLPSLAQATACTLTGGNSQCMDVDWNTDISNIEDMVMDAARNNPGKAYMAWCAYSGAQPSAVAPKTACDCPSLHPAEGECVLGYCNECENPIAKCAPESLGCGNHCCQNSCLYSGQRECAGNGYKICNDYNGDGCLEWGGVTYCDNGVYCDGHEYCGAGQCHQGEPITCSDGISCTVDSCNEATDSCSHKPQDSICDDGVFCNGNEFCSPYGGCTNGKAVKCNDGISCSKDYCNEYKDACDVDASACECFEDSDCDDGNACNGKETCSYNNKCVAGKPVICKDSVSCTIDKCDEETGACIHVPDDGACQDDYFCNGAEYCDEDYGCKPGEKVVCDDDLACSKDKCDEYKDQCSYDTGACECFSDSDCEDGTFCTDDRCDLKTNTCEHEPVSPEIEPCCEEDGSQIPEGGQPYGYVDIEYDFCKGEDELWQKVKDYYCDENGDVTTETDIGLLEDCRSEDYEYCSSWEEFCSESGDHMRRKECFRGYCEEPKDSPAMCISESEGKKEELVEKCEKGSESDPYCQDGNVVVDKRLAGCTEDGEVGCYSDDSSEIVEECGSDSCEESTDLDIYVKEHIYEENSCEDAMCVEDPGEVYDYCVDDTLHQVTCQGDDRGEDEIFDCASLSGCYPVEGESRSIRCRFGADKCMRQDKIEYREYVCSEGACSYDVDFDDKDDDLKDDRCDTCIDSDHDGACDEDDNCPLVSNINQRDQDNDGIGDECDNDTDGDGYPDDVDCSDAFKYIHPGREEVHYNGVDDDCDPSTEDIPGDVSRQTAWVDVSVLNEDDLRPGDSLAVTVRVKNLGDDRLRDVNVEMYFDDLGTRVKGSIGDISSGKTRSVTLREELPQDIEDTFIYARIHIGSSEFRRVIYREIYVGSP